MKETVRRRRLLVRVVIVWSLACVAVLGVAGPASAHSALLFSTPTADGASPDSPSDIQLVFDQPVTLSVRPVVLTDANGAGVAVGPTRRGTSQQVLDVPVLRHLPVGQYSVDWTVAAQDGDTVTGDFRFAVGAAISLSPARPSAVTTSSIVLATLRWLLFVGVALSLGGSLAARLARKVAPTATAPAPWTRLGAATALIAAIGLNLALAGSGSALHGFAQPDVGVLVSSTPGRIALVELLGSALGFPLYAWSSQRRSWWPLLLVVLAEGWRAHPHEYGAALGTAVTVIHFLAAAAWSGALVHVIRVWSAWRRQSVSAAPLVAHYARIAAWLFAAVVGSGVAGGLLIAPVGAWSHALTTTPYGWVLLLKLGLVGAAAVLALAARRHLKRQPDAAQPGRPARFEAVTLVAILASSALLTTLQPPVDSTIPFPFPPPPAGPTVGVGSRAGFIGISATASAGQLLIRLNVPDVSAGPGSREATGTIADQGAFMLTAQLVDPSGSTRDLPLRRCGYGCFVAPVTWNNGQSTVTFRAENSAWDGGTTAVNLTWPAESAPEDLVRVVAAMKAAPRFTVYERVTSNTNTAGAGTQVLPLTGATFIAASPYASARAPSVTVQARHGGDTVLALAFPGGGIDVLLTVDAHWRIVHELLTTPNEYVSRTVVYPERG